MDRKGSLMYTGTPEVQLKCVVGWEGSLMYTRTRHEVFAGA